MSGRVSPRTFRVRQLPARFDRLQTAEVLSRLIDGIDSQSDIDVLSLAPAVNPWERPLTKIATVTFRKEPHDFDDEDTEWVLPARAVGLAQNIVIDVHFLDFTVLNEVNPNDHVLDCIAISGLASHPFGSWKSRAGSSSYMWLRDGLPSDLPWIRNIIYGYDTKLINSQSFQEIDDLAVSLIHRLKTTGRSASSAKPLCFLAHSLGGIVLKRALVILANGGDAEHSMLKSVTAVIFFGVPNYGMHMSHLLPMVAGYPNEALVKQLSPNSEYLKILMDQFSGIAHLERVRLISIYETERSRTTEKLPSGSWARSGPHETLVDRTSAIHPGSAVVDTFPINRDHSNLVKFNESDSDYRPIVIYLHEISEPHLGRKFQPLTKPGLSLSQVMAGTRISPMERAILSKAPMAESSMASSSPSAQGELEHQRMTESLEAKEINSRYKKIDKAFTGTFEWIFNESSLGFLQWLKDGRGMYWIAGKPGSGKSTLMKYICEEPRTRNAIDSAEHPGTPIVAYFFFHNRGSHLQKSFEGLLSSVLSQIFEMEPRLQFCGLTTYRQILKRPKLEWLLSDLELTFENILVQNTVSVHVHLFVDALDEYEGSLELLVGFIKSVTTVRPASSTKIQICFSSRIWNVFIDNFQKLPGLKIHDHTRQDISMYVDGKINENPVLDGLLSAKSTTFATSKEAVKEEIIEKANGVFLWVNLTVENLARASADGASAEEIAEILSVMSTELEDLYEQIISRTASQNRHECYIMLEIALRAFRPMSVADFLVAVACARRPNIQNCMPLVPTEYPSTAEIDNMIRRIKSRCGGLLEVIEIAVDKLILQDVKEKAIEGFKTQVVQFMHQTVKDFVGRPAFRRLAMGQDYSLLAENGFSFLHKYNLTLIAAGHQDYLMMATYTEGKFDKDCLDYAYFAEISTGRARNEMYEGLSDQTLKNYFYSRWEKDRKGGDFGWRYPITSVMSYGVAANLALFVKEKLQQDASAISNPTMPLLHVAVEAAVTRAGRIKARLEKSDQKAGEIVRTLLDNGADGSGKFEGREPLQILALRVSRHVLFYEVTEVHLPGELFDIANILLTRIKSPHLELSIWVDLGKNPAEKYRQFEIEYVTWLRRWVMKKRCKPIHVAACLYEIPDSTYSLQLLLDHRGADVNALDELGLTALDIVLGALEIGDWGGPRGRLAQDRRYSVANLLAEAGGGVTEVGYKARPAFLDMLNGRHNGEAIRKAPLLEPTCS